MNLFNLYDIFEFQFLLPNLNVNGVKLNL